MRSMSSIYKEQNEKPHKNKHEMHLTDFLFFLDM